MAEASVKSGTPPYASFRTFLTLLEKLREGGVPHRLDFSYWSRYFSGSSGTALMSGLRFLGLVPQDSNVPFPALQELVGADPAQQKRDLEQLLRSRYRGVFEEIPDLSKVTTGHLDDVFRKQFKIDGDTHRKAVTFFVYAAQHVGMPISRYVTDRMKAGSGPSAGSRRSPRPVARRGGNAETLATQEIKSPPTDVTAAAYEPPSVPNGEAKTIQLPGGFTMTLQLSGSLFQLRGETREFVFDILDRLGEFEEKMKSATADGASSNQ